MDPMSYAFLFAIGWVMSDAFSEKRDEYSAAQEAHREKYLAKLDRDHPSWGRARRERYLLNAARRNTAGHWAYLLRHGWSPTLNDIGHGWKKAKEAHEEWKAEHPKDGEKRSRWGTFKAGWKNRWDQRPKDEKPTPAETKPAPEKAPIPAPADDAPDSDPWLGPDEARDAEIFPWPSSKTNNTQAPGGTAGSTNGEPLTTTIMTGEAHSIDDVRRNSASFVEILLKVNGAADQLLADTMRFAGKDVETRAHIERGMEALLHALAEFRAIPTSLQKHQTGEEYAQSAHSVNDIAALRSN